MVEGGESSVGIGKEVRFLTFFLCLEDVSILDIFLGILMSRGVHSFHRKFCFRKLFERGEISRSQLNVIEGYCLCFVLSSWKYSLVCLWSHVQDSYTLPTAEKQIKAAGASDTAMANSKNVMAQVILAWDTNIQERSKHHPRLQHLPHPHIHLPLQPLLNPHAHIPLPLPHPHHHLAQHAVNLRFYSLNLGTEVRIC